MFLVVSIFLLEEVECWLKLCNMLGRIFVIVFLWRLIVVGIGVFCCYVFLLLLVYIVVYEIFVGSIM